jgi:hypothetical protein
MLPLSAIIILAIVSFSLEFYLDQSQVRADILLEPHLPPLIRTKWHERGAPDKGEMLGVGRADIRVDKQQVDFIAFSMGEIRNGIRRRPGIFGR